MLVENADGILLNYEEKKSWIETKPNLQEYLVNKMVRKKDKGHLDSLGLLYFENSKRLPWDNVSSFTIFIFLPSRGELNNKRDCAVGWVAVAIGHHLEFK